MGKADNLVQNVFEQDMEIQKAYNTAFTQILN